MDTLLFEQCVAEAFAALPERFRRRVENVALLIDDEPSADVRAEEGLEENETLLSYYHGIPATERGAGYGAGDTLPDTITLYRLPILAEAGADSARIRSVIADTLWHEIAHHFGMDEPHVRHVEARRMRRS